MVEGAAGAERLPGNLGKAGARRVTLKQVGDFGLVLSASAMLTLTLLFLVFTKWYRNVLGRMVAGVLFIMSTIMAFAGARIAGLNIAGIMAIRATLYVTLGLAFWALVVGFIAAQFLLPPPKGRDEERKEDMHEDYA